MSTFTKIKTAIRDAGTMERILRAIPGAVVSKDVSMPVKGTDGRVREVVDFLVHLPPDSTVSTKKRYLYVERNASGVYYFEISDEQANAQGIARDVQQQVIAEQSRRDEAARVAREAAADARREERFAAEQRELAEEAGERRLAREAAKQEERKEAALRAQREAERIVADWDRTSPTAQGASPPTRQEPNAAASLAFANVLAQEYAKERILEQTADLEREYGVRLDSVERLEDGTIEITLRG